MITKGPFQRCDRNEDFRKLSTECLQSKGKYTRQKNRPNRIDLLPAKPTPRLSAGQVPQSPIRCLHTPLTVSNANFIETRLLPSFAQSALSEQLRKPHRNYSRMR
jgi:hypothetical protein